MDRIHFVGKLANALSPVNSNTLEQTLGVLVPTPIPVAVAYEIVLQSYLFYGYAQAIESAKVFAQLMQRRRLPIPHNSDRPLNSRAVRIRGEELCRRIYAPNYERLVANMAEVSAELANWMIAEGYGKVLSRPGPTELEREVASIVFLTVSGHPVQLYSHVRGARNLGATRELLISVLKESELNEPQSELVRDTVEKVFAA